jgi:hypothetical protein
MVRDPRHIKQVIVRKLCQRVSCCNTLILVGWKRCGSCRGRAKLRQRERQVRSVTPGGACHHSNNSGNVRSSTLGELFKHGQVQGNSDRRQRNNVPLL